MLEPSLRQDCKRGMLGALEIWRWAGGAVGCYADVGGVISGDAGNQRRSNCGLVFLMATTNPSANPPTCADRLPRSPPTSAARGQPAHLACRPAQNAAVVGGGRMEMTVTAERAAARQRPANAQRGVTNMAYGLCALCAFRACLFAGRPLMRSRAARRRLPSDRDENEPSASRSELCVVRTLQSGGCVSHNQTAIRPRWLRRESSDPTIRRMGSKVRERSRTRYSPARVLIPAAVSASLLALFAYLLSPNGTLRRMTRSFYRAPTLPVTVDPRSYSFPVSPASAQSGA